MISRAHRFHGYNSLRHVYGHGKTTRGPLFSVKSVLNERRKTYRVAVVVSRKIDKSAVARNRIRRRLYEIVRLAGVDIIRPYDIVITVFQGGTLETTHEKLTSQVRDQLSQAGVLARRVTRTPEQGPTLEKDR